MKSFSVKQYIVIPIKNKEELTEVLHNNPINNLPDCVLDKVANCESKACFFIIAEKQSSEYSAFASFVFENDDRKNVDVQISSTINDEKVLEKIISKLTDWTYNKIGGIYFRIPLKSVDPIVAQAAEYAGYKKKKSNTDVLVLDKNIEIGIISLISGL